jgi:hypothetical protein
VSSREAIIDALFTVLTKDDAYQTTGRRLILWSQVNEQPALFLRHVADEFPPRPTRMPPKTVIECEAWIYCNAGANPDLAPEVALNALLDGVETALKPAPGIEAQTLGGLVTHCWIEGRVEIHPGDLDGQAIAVVPIKMLVPTIL